MLFDCAPVCRLYLYTRRWRVVENIQRSMCAFFFVVSLFNASREFLIVIFDFNTDRRTTRQVKTRLCYIYSHIRFVCAWHWAQSEALIFISFRRQKKIGPDLCDKMWRWLHNTCKLNLLREGKAERKTRIQLWIWFEMRVLGQKKREYIDNYISDNGKSSNVSRIFVRIDKNLIRCHMFNIDQMKIQIVRSFLPLNTFNRFGWNWIFSAETWEMSGGCVIRRLCDIAHMNMNMSIWHLQKLVIML